MRRRSVNLAVAGMLAIAGAGLAQSASALPIDHEGWRLLGVPGVKESSIRWTDDETLEVTSDNSVAFFYREVMPQAQRLEWRWRVTHPGSRTDLRTPGQDDRPVALHLWFPKQDGSSPLFGWAASLLGYPPVGHAITYVWGGSEPRGTAFANPHMDESQGMIVILRSMPAATDAADGWMAESVDFAADYERYFGMPSPQPSHIAVSGDSDDLGGLRSALITGLRFVGPVQER